jgi:hypothetical protein
LDEAAKLVESATAELHEADEVLSSSELTLRDAKRAREAAEAMEAAGRSRTLAIEAERSAEEQHGRVRETKRALVDALAESEDAASEMRAFAEHQREYTTKYAREVQVMETDGEQEQEYKLENGHEQEKEQGDGHGDGHGGEEGGHSRDRSRSEKRSEGGHSGEGERARKRTRSPGARAGCNPFKFIRGAGAGPRSQSCSGIALHALFHVGGYAADPAAGRAITWEAISNFIVDNGESIANVKGALKRMSGHATRDNFDKPYVERSRDVLGVERWALLPLGLSTWAHHNGCDVVV